MNSNELNILQEADRLVSTERQKQYGSPHDNWAHTASIASSILKKELSAEDCIVVLLATKLSREIYKHKADNLIDICGYVKIWHMVKQYLQQSGNIKNGKKYKK